MIPDNIFFIFITSEVNCQWSSWSPWSQCSVTCGSGTKTRRRTKSITARNGGRDCAGTSTSSSTCTGLYQCRPNSQPSSSSIPKTRNTVLVVTGNPVSKSLPSEVFDLANEESKCTNLEEFPKRARAVGGLIDDIPVVCGGVDSNRNYIDDCVLIGKSKKIPMVSTRYTHTSVNLDSGRLWILGGANKSVSYLDTTEIVSINKSVKGIDLPSTWRFGCAVNVNNKIYLIGGKRNYDITNKIWIVDPSNGFKVEEGPPMNNRRSEHMCAVMPDNQTIIVAGTWEKKFGKTTEYYDIKSETWKMGKSFLHRQHDFLLGTMEQIHYAFTFQDQSYHFYCNNHKW